MKLETDGPGIGSMLILAALTVAPVAVAILMQHSALRQAIQMKGWHYVKLSAGRFERAAARIESIATTRYDIARL